MQGTHFMARILHQNIFSQAPRLDLTFCSTRGTQTGFYDRFVDREMNDSRDRRTVVKINAFYNKLFLIINFSYPFHCSNFRRAWQNKIGKRELEKSKI